MQKEVGALRAAAETGFEAVETRGGSEALSLTGSIAEGSAAEGIVPEGCAAEGSVASVAEGEGAAAAAAAAAAMSSLEAETAAAEVAWAVVRVELAAELETWRERAAAARAQLSHLKQTAEQTAGRRGRGHGEAVDEGAEEKDEEEIAEERQATLDAKAFQIEACRQKVAQLQLEAREVTHSNPQSDP